jgi:hypothetical protein
VTTDRSTSSNGAASTVCTALSQRLARERTSGHPCSYRDSASRLVLRFVRTLQSVIAPRWGWDSSCRGWGVMTRGDRLAIAETATSV